MRWLALDVGTRRIGVATCDADERVVTASAAIPAGSHDHIAAVVGVMVREREIEGIVLGLPVTRGGTGRGERRVHELAGVLSRAVGVQVCLHDERGSTQEADRRLAEAGVPGRRRGGLLDSLAAQIILESFLSQRGGRHGVIPARAR